MPRVKSRWVGVVLLVLVALWGTYRILEGESESVPGEQSNQLLLFALSLAVVVLALGLAGVLIRNLVKLILDRKRGILGSQLRVKLVFFFLALVLLPSIVLFYGSAAVIKNTLDALLSTPIGLTRQAREIADQWRDSFEARCLLEARGIAAELNDRPELLLESGREELSALVEAWRARDDLQVVEVALDGRAIARAQQLDLLGGPGRAEELERLVARLRRRALSRRADVSRSDRLADGLLIHAATPVGGRGSVGVGKLFPPSIAGNLESMIAADQEFARFKLQRRELVRFYLTLIGVIFLATLFVATWVGFYTARRITVPIQEMADAAREISAGNLDVRVGTQVGDELGMLVEAFNEMAAELRDVTAVLRQSNQELDERRRYVETLVAQLSTAVLSLDPELHVTMANPAVASILGLRLSPGDDVGVVFARSGLSALGELVHQVAQARGEMIRRDLELPGPRGQLTVAVQVSVLKGRGQEVVGTLVMVEDLTELLRAQRAMAWQEVARRLAHEIKNPLTPIQLSAQRLRKKYDEGAGDLGEVLVEATASIEHEVRGLMQLVDEFSRYARMPELRPQSVDLEGVVNSALALYRGQPDIHWEVAIDPAIDRVTLDAEQMRRALINLIDNAIAAMAGRGSISIRAAANAKEGRVRIEIADTGPGIPAGDRDKMFAPNFSTKSRGTGLGLAIVHKVISDHHGTIHVEDNEPRGARFVIEIPE